MNVYNYKQDDNDNYLNARIYKNDCNKDDSNSNSNYLNARIYNKEIKQSKYSFNNPQIYLKK